MADSIIDYVTGKVTPKNGSMFVKIRYALVW